MTSLPAKRPPLRETLGEVESPLEVAMKREHAAKLARKRNRGAVMEAILTEGPATLHKSVVTSPEVAQQWTSALEQPVRQAVAKSFGQHPERIAAVVAPAVSEALKVEVGRTKRRWSLGVGRFLSGLSSARVWRWMAEALWAGEPVMEFVEQRSKSWEILELFLHDPSGTRLFCDVRQSGVDSRILEDSEELQQLPPEAGKHYSFVGGRCRLTARVAGVVTPEVKQLLQALCLDLDGLLEETSTDPQQRALLLPLRMKTGLSSDGPLTVRNASTRTFAAALALLLLLAASVAWLGSLEYRWQRFLHVLSHEPGIQVTSHERGWGRTVVEGIRNAESRDPGALAVALGLDPENMSLNFKDSIVALGKVTADAGQPPQTETAALQPVQLPGARKLP